MKNLSEFKSKKEFFAYLQANKSELISFKKSEIKFTDPFAFIEDNEAQKALTTSYKDDVASGVIKRTIIGNTYNWMDSQSDVLCDNCFEKSIKDRSDKIFHLHDHLRQVTAKVGTPTAIYEKNVSWKDLGVDCSGKTQCLLMDSNIKKDFNAIMFGQYLGDEITQHSVGLYYVNLEMAIDDADMKEEYATWLKYIDKIGNKDKVKEQGYFWAVKEAKLIEISAVLAGSNELTPTISNESKATVNNPQKNNFDKKEFSRKLVSELNK